MLATMLVQYGEDSNVIVLGLPRGGVPVAFEIAGALNAALDVYLVRKLRTPGQPELAMGACAEDGTVVVNDQIVSFLGIEQDAIDTAVEQEQKENIRNSQIYRDGRDMPSLEERIVVLVDDGLATGATMQAAVRAARQQAPSRIVVAVPVAPPEVLEELREDADEVVCAMTPSPFMAVGAWYENFEQTETEEVRDLLHTAWDRYPSMQR
jgi:predicted phosphoribosyltransferase